MMQAHWFSFDYCGDSPLPIITPFLCQCGARLLGSTGDGVNWQTSCPRCSSVAVSIVAIAEEV
jgi:hypothetical protein